jgi:hypothetical protein
MLNKIQLMEKENPKEFWNLVNSIKSRRSLSVSSEVPATHWYNYFQDLNKVTYTTDNLSNEAK